MTARRPERLYHLVQNQPLPAVLAERSGSIARKNMPDFVARPLSGSRCLAQ